MNVVNKYSPLRTCASRYHIQSRVIKNLLDEYESNQLSRISQEKDPLVDTNTQNHITRWAQQRLGLNHINRPYTDWEMLTAC